MDKLKTTAKQTDICTFVKEFSTEQDFSCSLTLPEYFGDIVKVLRCCVTPVAASVNCGSGRITAEGVNVIRIVYSADNGGIYSYETGEQFSKYIDVSGCDDECNLIDFIWADGVVCRAVSPRRLEVRANVRFKYKVYKKMPLVLLNDATGDGIQTKTCAFTAENTENIVAKKLTVNDTFTLPAGKSAANRIISVSADAAVTDTRSISNKIMMKGELNLKVLYVPEGEQDALESVTFSLPFSEILDVPGIREEMKQEVRIKVINADVSMKPMQNGSMRNMECNATMQAVVACGSQTQEIAVTDAFSTEYETELKTVQVNSVVHSQHLAESFVTDGVFELADLTPEAILDYDCRVQTVKATFLNEKLTVGGTVVFGLMLNTAAGTVSYVERNLDFNYTKEMIGVSGEAVFEPVLSISAAAAVLNGHRADVKTEIFIEGELSVSKEITAVSEVAVFEDRPKKKDGSGMIIYFADKDESLWSIAKKYNTSPELLASDNKIDGDTVPEKQTLLISCI